ncbi:MAG: dephospho-CoA kinase [Leptospiraceae bacterium]|nr:dephospho-CoA kinase [Leptospiraceae bacterium]
MKEFPEIILLGVTGGMGSGKSTVAKILEELGCYRINADELARFYTSPETPILETLKEILGEEILDEKGFPDRKKISAIVFSDKEKLQKLNSLIHPLVRKDMLQKISKLEKGTIVAWEAPLLFEAGGDSICDFTLTVFADFASAEKRVLKRDGISALEFAKRMQNQMIIKEKIKRSDFNIENSEISLEELKKKAEGVLNSIKKEMGQRP